MDGIDHGRIMTGVHSRRGPALGWSLHDTGGSCQVVRRRLGWHQERVVPDRWRTMDTSEPRTTSELTSRR
jgi:hypothetical protein